MTDPNDHPLTPPPPSPRRARRRAHDPIPMPPADDEADPRSTRAGRAAPPRQQSAGLLGLGMIGMLVVVVLANAC
jgi:hypothetical protein